MPTILGLTNEKSPHAGRGNSPHVSSSTTMGSNARLDTISKRNHAAAREMETLLWRALCDEPETLREYLAHDCIMINPLLAPDGSSEPLSKDTRPGVVDVLQAAAAGRKLAGFRIHGQPLVVEVDLMAVALVYKISLFRQGRKGQQEIVASASSTWRQTAGADWLLVAFHVQYADEEEEEEEEEER
ncbi:uncharacterized protein THITE_2147947 [Thermothielavioides terrestris NRRL 8126]|jgi:hypothetical protein|uniref:Uncharacterized protein n=1 Tax=Thermothielavioides terrestris (strain ATCC 38088 / NRRL 8126) TaxID=578455 RepID=G2RHG0_THETT|nr:uncharacterized protein THITE_2147947 [Thermothielavioides terrestris NRRL 8126]AEO71272.1 hypothetical protein THITE_2147947 [Thermothielavioides terrestris NRRL 8126]